MHLLERRTKPKFSIVPIPDVHAPFTDKGCWRAGLDVVRGFRKEITHVVILGDFGDFAWASDHPRSEPSDIDGEYRQMAEHAKELRDAAGERAGQIKWFWMQGNHEYRIDRRNVKCKMRDGLLPPWKSEYKDSFAHLKIIRYSFSREGMLRIGNTVCYHGSAVGETSDRTEGLRMRHLVGDSPNLLTVRGHTHTVTVPQPIRIGAGVRSTQWMFNPGHWGPADPPYAENENRTTWGSAVSVIRQWGNELPRVQYEIVR